MYTNLFSLLPKFDLLLLYANTRKQTFDNKNNSQGKTGGIGLAMDVRDNLYDIPIVAKCNHVWRCRSRLPTYIDIQFNTCHVLLVGVYRLHVIHDDTCRARDTKLSTNILAASDNTIIIGGDFNYPTIKRPILIDQHQSKPAELFKDVLAVISSKSLITNHKVPTKSGTCRPNNG